MYCGHSVILQDENGRYCPECGARIEIIVKDFGEENHEIVLLKDFLREFNPIVAHQDLELWAYDELVEAVKETVKEM